MQMANADRHRTDVAHDPSVADPDFVAELANRFKVICMPPSERFRIRLAVRVARSSGAVGVSYLPGLALSFREAPSAAWSIL